MAGIEVLRKCGCVLGVVAGLAAPASSAAAQESEQAYFSGKTVRFIVGLWPRRRL